MGRVKLKSLKGGSVRANLQFCFYLEQEITVIFQDFKKVVPRKKIITMIKNNQSGMRTDAQAAEPAAAQAAAEPAAAHQGRKFNLPFLIKLLSSEDCKILVYWIGKRYQFQINPECQEEVII